MAKAKAKAKSKGKKAQPSKVPAGYRVISRAASWDPDKNPVIEGERSRTKDFSFTDKETGERRSASTMIVQDETIGAVVVWENNGLRDFFEQTKAGDVVRIEYLGRGKPFKKGQEAPRLYNALVKD